MTDYYLIAQIYKHCPLDQTLSLISVNSEFNSDKWWQILTQAKFGETNLIKPADFPWINWFSFLSISQTYGFDGQSANKALMNNDCLALVILLGCEICPSTKTLLDYLAGNPKKRTVECIFKYFINLRPFFLDLLIKEDLINWLIPFLEKNQVDLNLMTRVLLVLDKKPANNLIKSWFKIIPPNQKFLNMLIGLGFFKQAEYLIKMGLSPSEEAFIFSMKADLKNLYLELENRYNLKIKTEEEVDKFKEIAIGLGALNFLKYGFSKDFSFDAFDIKRILERENEEIIIWAVDNLKIPKNKWKFMADPGNYSDSFIAHFIKLGYKTDTDYVLRLIDLNYIISLALVY